MVMTEKNSLAPDEVRFRLLRSDDIPATNPHNFSYQFGLQDKQQNVVPGVKQSNGFLAFDFTLKVKNGRDPRYPVFTGRFASGSVDDRFVYLSWRAVERGDWINRVKARLSTIDWRMIHASRKHGRPITADMTGRGPGDGKKHLRWYLG